MSLLLLALAACVSEPPEVLAVTPAEVQPGDALRISGRGFEGELAGALVRGEERVPLPVHLVSQGEATATVPDDVPSGRWSVQVETPRGRHGAGFALEVWRPDTEPACDKRYALDVETSRTLGKVVLERVFRDRPSQREVFLSDRMAGLELTRSTTADGATCSAVWLLDAQGRRWLLADDRERDLGPVARELSTSLKLSLREG